MVKYTKLEDILGLKFITTKSGTLSYTISKIINRDDFILLSSNSSNFKSNWSLIDTLKSLNNGTWIPIEEQPKEIIINLW